MAVEWGFPTVSGGNVTSWDPTGWGGLTGDVAATFAGQPSALWQAARTAQLGNRALNPQWQRTIQQGFTPTYGRYLLGGAPTTFADYLSGQAGQFGGAAATGTVPAYSYDVTSPITTPGAVSPLQADWADTVAASQAIANPMQAGTTIDPTRMGLLQGENARQNMLAMAAARLGGGIGIGAQARQRALGSLYDVYAARAAGAGDPTGGFLSWLDPRLTPLPAYTAP